MAKCMKTDEIHKIESMLERFFEGKTTAAEEKELYAFFARPGLSARWKPYQPLFGFFGNDLPATSSSLPPGATWHTPASTGPARSVAQVRGEAEKPTPPRGTGIPHSSGKKPSVSPTLLRFLAGCAAAVLLGLVSLPFIAPERTASDPYEGSYLVRKGVRITDPRLIRPELEATLQRVAALEREMEKRTQLVPEEKAISFPVADPFATVCTDLWVRYPAGFVRDEARKMLGLQPER